MEIEFEHHLAKRVREIENDIKNDNFQTRKTEDFFLRLLNKVYTNYHFKNLGPDKSNTEAIDLIDIKKGELGIQITARKSGESTKIENTLSKAITYWKVKGVKVVWILFISETGTVKGFDTLNEKCNRDGVSIFIKTISRIVSDINEKSKSEIKEIDEFLLQETSSPYLGLSKLSLFKQIEKGQKFVNSNLFNHIDAIYFTNKEKSTIKFIADNLSIGKLKEYAILGNPCSGKTTFAVSIIQQIRNRKVFYLDLSNPTINRKDLIDELIQISHNYSVLVIDNLHDNIELSIDLRERIAKTKIVSVLFLSRYYKTIDHFNNDSIYKTIEGMEYFWINPKENFEEKVSGIIGKKIQLQRESGSKVEWYKGDFQKILENTSRNLLKLNIALRMWVVKNSQSNPVTFDSIDSDTVLEYFFEEHKLGKFKTEALYTYCILYKNDIPFIPNRKYYEDNLLLREKGIILQYFNSDFFYFPHKEYAQLIFDSFSYMDCGISSEKKFALVKNYIHCFNTSENTIRLGFVFSKLNNSEDKEILGQLFNDEKIALMFQNEIKDSETKIFQAINSLNILVHNSEKIDNKRLEELYFTFLYFFKNNKLSLYLEDHYLTLNRLKKLSSLLNIELKDEQIAFVQNRNQISNNSIVDLTLKISRKSKESDRLFNILHSYTFQEWLNMILGLQKLSKITNSLSELNTSSEAKKLLSDLFRKIDWEKQYRNATTLKIDEFAKSLNEIGKIDVSIGSNIARFFFKNAEKDSLFKTKLQPANLSEYSKALSDLSKVDINFVRIQLSKDIKDNVVFDKFSVEQSLSNFTTRAKELRKLVEDSKTYFSVLKTIVLTDTFTRRIKEENNLNALLDFYEFASEYLNLNKLNLKEDVKKSIESVLVKTDNKLEILKNPKILNIGILSPEFIDSIKPIEIDKYFVINKITYAEDLFRVLTAIDLNKTILKFKNLNNEVFVRALLNPDLNFSQAIESLNKIKNKLFENETNNCDLKIAAILDGYLNSYTINNKRYSRVSINDFFSGYYFGICIDQYTIERYCKKDFFNKVTSTNHNNFEIAPLFQYLRRLSDKTNNQLDKQLNQFLIINTDNFIEAIKNEEINKTLSALSELASSKFELYADELLFNCKKVIISKVVQLKSNKIYKTKLLPDLKKIAKDKSKVILKELT